MQCGFTPAMVKTMSTSRIRCYSELVRIPTFRERYEYLKLNGVVSEMTFGGNRYINQAFYQTREWQRVRQKVILRDMACDLGIPGYELDSGIYIHHMNPITLEDLEEANDFVFNPEYLITTSFRTHQAIHYGSSDQLPSLPIERRPGDTCPWLQPTIQ